MKQRIISALIGVVIFFAVFFANSNVLTIAVLVVSEIAIWEMLHALGYKNKNLMGLVAMLLPVCLTLNYYFDFSEPVIFIYIMAMLLLVIMLFKRNEYKYQDAGLHFISSVVISMSFFAITLIRSESNGLINVFLVFVGSWITDTCAYFAGRAFGKHKLAPVVSPKKTVEGSIGGVIGTSIIFLLYAFIISKTVTNCEVNYINALILGFLCGGISQIGDLCASSIKREHNIKDYGNIMPGHGGVLDRFDSVLFVAPTVYFFIEFLPLFI